LRLWCPDGWILASAPSLTSDLQVKKLELKFISLKAVNGKTNDTVLFSCFGIVGSRIHIQAGINCSQFITHS
jgi:hypothetical protein